MFPLSTDHLIPLLQYNTLRACLTNRKILSVVNADIKLCGTEAFDVLPWPSDLRTVPPSLRYTTLQSKIPHEDWVDMVPHPKWRDNLILALGTFDPDELWHDTLGGLFKGFPASEVEHTGIIAWTTPWNVDGWELSEGFVRKWTWLLMGCEEVLEATNRWRIQRGESSIQVRIPSERATGSTGYSRVRTCSWKPNVV